MRHAISPGSFVDVRMSQNHSTLLFSQVTNLGCFFLTGPRLHYVTIATQNTNP